MSSSHGRSRKKNDPLNKRIPENPRYAHVEAVVDSGASINKYLRHLQEIKQNYRYRKDEIFKRLKPTTFAQLILQVAQQEEEDEDGTTTVPSDSPPDTARSTLNSLITGMGEMDIKELNYPQALPPPPPPLPPYLLLDVRDREDYEHAHVVTAKHYPPAMLNRSCNFFTRDILEYKNHPGRIIILYDEDERIVPQVASTFVQREVDNVFMLSGGLRVLHKAFPDCMITGQVPTSCLVTPPGSARRTNSSGKMVQLSSSSQQGRYPIAPGNKIPHVGSVELKETFTRDDLDKIQVCLDTALLPPPSAAGSAMGSRVNSRNGSSMSQVRSCTSSTSTRSSSSTGGKQITTPWK